MQGQNKQNHTMEQNKCPSFDYHHTSTTHQHQNTPFQSHTHTQRVTQSVKQFKHSCAALNRLWPAL